MSPATMGREVGAFRGPARWMSVAALGSRVQQRSPSRTEALHNSENSVRALHRAEDATPGSRGLQVTAPPPITPFL